MASKFLTRFVTARWFILLAGIILGAIAILGVRFVTYHTDAVHYHANFALYINGQQEPFKGSQYYEEEAMCSIATTVTPETRAHMHDNINDVVHVEDHAVTWGQFFANLGWTLGPNFIARPDGTIFAAQGDMKLNVLLNGQDHTGVNDITNTVINDEDKLLISYGDESSASLQQQYHAIPSTAHHYDVTPDPASCSGQTTSDFSQRMQHLF